MFVFDILHGNQQFTCVITYDALNFEKIILDIGI